MTEELAGVSGYDWPLEMAKLGHVSLTIDLLGYDSSVRPDGPHGFLNCMGSQADVTHQIVGQLRSGRYSLDGGVDDGVAFSKVVLAGHDVGGYVAQIEAYSYQDVSGGEDIDGLVTVEIADQGFTDYLLGLFARANAFCASGGENREQESDPPAGPGAYFHLPGPDDWRTVLFEPGRAEPGVVEAAIRLANRNPCAWESSAAEAVAVDRARLREIDAPVLLVFPEDDPIFTTQGQEQQRANYCESCDVTTVFLPGGHFPMLELNVADYRAAVSKWLCQRDLVSDGISACNTPGKVTGGGQIEGTEPVFSSSGDLLSLPAIMPSASSASSGGASQANFGLVAEFSAGQAAPSGKLNYRDHGTGDVIKATSLDGLSIDGSHAVIHGMAAVNGAAGKPFRAEVDDLGTGDAFSIEVLEPGGYSNSGRLLGGNIEIHR